MRRAEAGKLEAVRCTLEDVETLTSPWDKSPEAWRKSVRAGCEALRQAIISEGAYQPGSLQQFLVSIDSTPHFCQPFRPSLIKALEGAWHAKICCCWRDTGISLQGGLSPCQRTIRLHPALRRFQGPIIYTSFLMVMQSAHWRVLQLKGSTMLVL